VAAAASRGSNQQLKWIAYAGRSSGTIFAVSTVLFIFDVPFARTLWMSVAGFARCSIAVTWRSSAADCDIDL
jgi:hypothetical protein